MKQQARRFLAPVAIALGATLAGCGGDDSDAPAADASAPMSEPAPSAPAEDQPVATTDVAPPPATTDPGSAEMEMGASAPLVAAGLQWRVPDSWSVRLPSGGMRAAELGLPGDGELADAQLIVFHFGPSGAGNVEDNLDRWARQVVDANGAPASPSIDAMQVGDLRITMMATSGTYKDGAPGQAPTDRPGYAMRAAIIEGGPQGPAYLRLTGPEAVVAVHDPMWMRMLESVAPAP